ncbi:hypothetical protein [Mycobacterium sp.]|uniref:hypothetical protein n=1 Tax=Mycobacterium sp. TaxID=1785 RepID=UPI003F7FCA78
MATDFNPQPKIHWLESSCERPPRHCGTLGWPARLQLRSLLGKKMRSPLGKKMTDRQKTLADEAAEALFKAIRDSAQKAKPPELLQLAEACAAIITAQEAMTAREAARVAGLVAKEEELVAKEEEP